MSHTATQASTTSDLTRAAPTALQRACACGAAKGVEDQCPSCAAKARLGVQPKLTVNRPGDRYEQEADRIADRVVSAGPPGPVAGTAPTLQREMAEEEDELQAKPAGVQRMEEGDDELQRKPASLQRMEADEDELQAKSAGPTPANQAMSRAAAAVSGGGQPLSRAERSYFEPRLGRDLSAVRLHDDAHAATAARGINARAYTLRNHIAFAPGAYDSRSTTGRRLMAHELVHTVQQGQGLIPRIQRDTHNETAAQNSTAADNKTNPTLKPTCDSDTQTALALAKNRAVGALGRTVEALSKHKSRMSAKRRNSQDRKVDRALKAHLGVRRSAADDFETALATLKAAEAFLNKQDLSKNHIICNHGLPKTPCRDANNAGGYHKNGRIYVCTNSSSMQTFVQFGINKAETAEERAKRIKEQLEDEAEAKDRAAGRDTQSSDAVPGQEPAQQGAPGGGATAGGTSDPNAAITGGQQAGGADVGSDPFVERGTSAAPTRFEREAAGRQADVGKNEILVAQTRLASFLIHEAMHDAIKGKEIDVYKHDQFYEHMGRKRPSAPPNSAFTLINPDSYVMFVLQMEESGNTFDSEADDNSRLERDLGEYGFTQLRLRTPRNTKQSENLTVRPLLDNRKIKNSYSFAGAAMHETFTSLDRAAEEIGGPESDWTHSTQEIVSVLESRLGFARASAQAGGNPQSGDGEALRKAATALNNVYLETFLGKDSRMVVYRRYKGLASAEYFVKVPFHGEYKRLSPSARVELILDGAGINARVDAAYQDAGGTDPNPIKGKAVDLLIAFSSKHGILSV